MNTAEVVVNMPPANAMEAGQFIQLDNVFKAYNNELVVMDGMNLDMRADDRLVIIGPSGSGKSSLLRVLMGLEGIQGGDINFHGQPYIKSENNDSKVVSDELHSRVGMVFQHYTLFPHLTVMGNLILAPMKVHGKDKQSCIAKGRELLARLGLEDKVDYYPSQLSGGQKQRVAIARALMLEPELMLFDEVTSALDPEMVTEVQNVMMQLAEQKMAMIIVTHDMHFAREIATRVVFCAGGKIVEQGTPDEVFGNPKEARTREFLDKVLHLN
ncbi:amino acid ABC transporter ATP-binding protein [Oceanobacter kriegii]|uniref:amino acid ABC transporter ATP-binding protein n=1 Tax=Oceanobacter kriegii TaxID=64972 RepID=UPI00041A1080|nr:amino acid ABC transporter ATP-binding protein [Oceanobacter kriegii]